MKALYTSVFALVLAGTSFGQQTKTKMPTGEGVAAMWHTQSPSRGQTIYSEDFASGIPATWSNVTASGPVDWKYTTTGHSGDYPTAAIQSSTASNGWIIVDSDADNFSGGGAEDAQLTTGVIDCSGFTNVKVEFQQMFRRWQSDITTVRVTVDTGATWTDFVLNSAITQSGTDNPDFVNIDISAAIASSPSSVQIQLWWQGAWDYGWQIDDFAIKEIDANDIILKRPALSNGVTYYQVPESQTQDLNFHAFVENIGFTDQTNVDLNVDVATGGSSLYNNTSSSIATLAVGTTDSLGIAAPFTPTSVGTYDVTFTANQSEADDVTSNNEIVLNFDVTDSVYAVDNDFYAGQWWNLDASSSGSDPFEIGAVFEAVNDDKTGTCSIFFGDNSADGAFVDIILYQYDAVNDLYNQISQANYDITAADLGNWVTVTWDDYAELNAGEVYVVAVNHYGGSLPVYIGYGSNPSNGSVISNDGNGGAWNNQPRAAMIRLNVNSELSVTNGPNVAFEVMPNPTTENISIQLEQAQPVSVKIADMTAKMISVQEFGATDRIEMNMSDLPAGAYLVSVITENGATTKKIIKK